MVKTDEYGNQDCSGLQNCRGCINCDNSTRCDNSTGCNNSTRCNNSTGCNNSTRCDNCAYCLYCSNLALEKFMVFNKSVMNKEAYIKILDKVRNKLGYYKHPKNLTKEDIAWLKNNIKQFDRKVLDKIIENSILPDKTR